MKYRYKNDDIKSMIKIGNGYLVKLKNNDLGYIDKNSNIIIPYQHSNLIDSFKSNDKKDICLGFHNLDTNKDIYYHLGMDDNKVSLKFDTESYDDDLKLYIVDKNSKYWVLEDSTMDKYALYDYKEGNIKSFFFDEVIFVVDPINNHNFFYKINIVNEKYEPYSYKFICGYLDHDANLSSHIFDSDTFHLYDAKIYGPNTLSKTFNELLLLLSDMYLEECLKAEDEINNRIIALNENNYFSKDKAKIIEFNPNRKKV